MLLVQLSGGWVFLSSAEIIIIARDMMDWNDRMAGDMNMQALVIEESGGGWHN